MPNHLVTITHITALDTFEARCGCGFHLRSSFGPVLCKAAEYHHKTGRGLPL